MKVTEWGTGVVIVVAGVVLAGWNVRVGQRLSALEQRPGPVAAGQSDSATTSVNGIVLGNPKAPITIVEFTDYQCPFCRRFAEETLPLLITDYIAQGKVRLILRDLPIRTIHPNALALASAARCAAAIDMDRFETFHIALFQHANDDVTTAVSQAAASAALDPADITACMEVDQYVKDIEKDEAEAVRIGVRSTPTFIIGRSGDGATVSGTMIRGAQPTATFVAAVESLLLPVK